MNNNHDGSITTRLMEDLVLQLAKSVTHDQSLKGFVMTMGM
jgi:hypothetical protein